MLTLVDAGRNYEGNRELGRARGGRNPVFPGPRRFPGKFPETIFPGRSQISKGIAGNLALSQRYSTGTGTGERDQDG